MAEKTMEELQAELEKLKQENENLKSKKSGQSELTFKVSAKGAVSVYGMGRFPVTLYKQQWEKLFSRASDLLQFIRDNESDLSTK
jgi:ribosome-interacting GTPase 1